MEIPVAGGLVSALVIARLSVTEPGKAPSVVPGATEATSATTTIAILYLLGWMATGLTALVRAALQAVGRRGVLLTGWGGISGEVGSISCRQ